MHGPTQTRRRGTDDETDQPGTGRYPPALIHALATDTLRRRSRRLGEQIQQREDEKRRIERELDRRDGSERDRGMIDANE